MNILLALVTNGIQSLISLQIQYCIYCCWAEFHCPSIWECIGVILTITAIVLYFLKPWLCYKASREEIKNEDHLKVTVYNRNLFRTVKEVECEISITKDNWHTSKTLNLRKSRTLAIKTGCAPYIFVSDNCTDLDNYPNIRVRLLATNLIGIKKLYERYYKLVELPNETVKVP